MSKLLPFLGYGFLLPLLCSALLCRLMRRKLGWLRSRERKVGKEKIHRLFPHPRRPLSGGFAILLSFTAGLLAFNWPPNALVWLFLCLVWLFGLIGLIDDLGKIGGRGLSEREKLALQAFAGLAFAYLLHSGITSLRFGLVQLPFAAQPLDLGAFYPFFGMFVIVAASNAVNLTDGMDGLAGGQVVIACCFMLILAGLLQKPLAVGVFLSLSAATLGFLLFNYPPAKLLMGDMGSLSLGAAMGAGAMLMGMEFYLPLVAAVFVINTLSVIVQIGTVRVLWRFVRFPRHGATEPFRPFLCTPLHHHFQWLGWPEKSILRLFWTTGAIFGALALLAFKWGGAWIFGLALIPVPLILTAAQKLLRGSFFIGLTPAGEAGRQLALFQGMPAEIFGKKLYRPLRQTSLLESTLAPGTPEGFLWRPMTEIEARVALGSLFMQQHLGEEALAEWEQIPLRNLLLRESVVLQLARLYYSHDRLLEAIRLWEALPGKMLTSMPNLQEIVRTAKLRLAELAHKSSRQCMNSFERAQAGQAFDLTDLARQITLSLRYNRDLLELLSAAHAPRAGGSLAVRASALRSQRRADRALRERIITLERSLDWCDTAAQQARPGAGGRALTSSAQLAEQIKDRLWFEAAEIEEALSQARKASAKIVSFQPSGKASRNAIGRLGVEWTPPEAGPKVVVAKSYLEGRVAFFSACYRRERALLEMLAGYGCPVPMPHGGMAKADRALLLMEAHGSETLADRLEGLEVQGREQLLTAAVITLANLHRQAALHLSELKEEVRRVDKETLTPQYYLSAFRIALERLFSADGDNPSIGNLEEILRQYQPVARLLAGRPESFIHFEFTPQHLLLDAGRMTIFDFEQATIGPAEFDLACLLSSPEADLPPEAARSLVRVYEARAGFRLDLRALDYASLSKNLTYAGAALNFYSKFGGDYHLQRLDWYLRQCQLLLGRHSPLGPLRRLLGPRLEQARRRSISAARTAQAKVDHVGTPGDGENKPS